MMRKNFCLTVIVLCVMGGYLHAEANRGPVRMPGGKAVETVFQTGFEKGEGFPDHPGYELTGKGVRSGNRCLTTNIGEQSPIRQYRIPVEGKKGRRLRISLWRKARRKCRFGLFLEQRSAATGKLVRTRLYTHPVIGGWEKYTATFVPTADKDCDISIVFPSYHGHQNATQAWLDDVKIQDMGPAVTWSRGCWEDFPALASDGKGRIWLAVIERRDVDPTIRPQVAVYRVIPGQ